MDHGTTHFTSCSKLLKQVRKKRIMNNYSFQQHVGEIREESLNGAVEGVVATSSCSKNIHHSHNVDNKDHVSGNMNRNIFPVKLYHILQLEERYGHIISWMQGGNTWKVHDPERFENEVMKQFFDMTKFSSFTRQVNGWGFCRITSGSERNLYYHEKFQRDYPEQVKQMRRCKKSSNCNSLIRTIDSSEVAQRQQFQQEQRLDVEQYLLELALQQQQQQHERHRAETMMLNSNRALLNRLSAELLTNNVSLNTALLNQLNQRSLNNIPYLQNQTNRLLRLDQLNDRNLFQSLLSRYQHPEESVPMIYDQTFHLTNQALQAQLAQRRTNITNILQIQQLRNLLQTQQNNERDLDIGLQMLRNLSQQQAIPMEHHVTSSRLPPSTPNN